MDTSFPQSSKFKTYVIAGSIAAVIVGLLGGIIFLSRRRSASEPPAMTAAPPGNTTSASTSTKPTTSSASTPQANGSSPQGISVLPNAPYDYGQGSDEDKDGLTDAEEAVYRTDPRKADTDGDAYSDADEVRVHGTDPLDAKSNPKTTQGLYHPDKGQPGP